jgi:hypothetical protein
VLPGFLAHQAGPSVLWSRLFGLVVGLSLRHFSLRRALLLGSLVGLVALLVDGYLLMPGIQDQLHGHNIWAQNVPRWVAWITHGVFGASLGFFYWLWQPREPLGRPKRTGGRGCGKGAARGDRQAAKRRL